MRIPLKKEYLEIVLRQTSPEASIRCWHFFELERGEMLMGRKKNRTKTCLVLFTLIAIIMLVFGPAVSAEDLLAKSERINKACLRCHAAKGINADFDGVQKDLNVDPEAYKVSMHGTMPCIYCHTNIKDYPHTDALKGKALVAQVNSECRRCHQDITPLYNQSVHGQINKQGRQNAYCSECHGIHNIYKKEVAEAKINHNVVPETCGQSAQCHKELLKEYETDFHAKSVLLGGQEAASCVSCHGSHTILGPEEEASTVSPANTPKTCAKCHLVPLENFAKGKMHYKIAPTGDGAVSFWTLIFFTWLTISCIALVLILILLELRRKWSDAGRPDRH